MKDGRTLPIKFRIEEGAVFVIGSEGGTFTALEGAVQMDIPAGALPEGVVGITVEPVPESDIPTDAGLIAGTVFDLQPDGTAFSPGGWSSCPASSSSRYFSRPALRGFSMACRVILIAGIRQRSTPATNLRPMRAIETGGTKPRFLTEKYPMYGRKSALIFALPLLAACTDLEPFAPEIEDAGAIQAAKGGNPGKPGGGDGDSFSYTITDLGGKAASDINSTGVLVGGRLGDPSPTFGTRRAVLWDAGTFAASDLPQLTAEANFSWAYAINSAGQVVGESNRAADEWPATPIIWDTNGTIRVLLELAGQYTSQVYGINESGQVVGYRRVNDGTYRNHAVLWDTDGTITITELGELPGYDFSWAHAINNAGQVAGISNNFGDYESGRAVLWETAGGVVSLLNLDPTGRSDAADIGEPDAAEAVEVAGTATTASGVRVATVWTVQNGSVVTVRRLDAESGNANSADAINDVGQVVVQVSGGLAVWTPETDLLEPLPSLSKRCSSRGGDINNDGTVAGWSGVFAKGRCVYHAVVWTKIN